MKTSQAGVDLIKSFEGCRLKAYKDIVGVVTIGYGHTGDDIYENQIISQDEADQLLLDDLCIFEKGVTSFVSCPLTQNQFDALVSFSYNLGLTALKTSTLLKKLNNEDYGEAADEFLKWDKAGGVVVPGILRRRQLEQALFLTA